MDKIDTFKAMLPFIPIGYRRPLLLIIHIEELMRIINSMNECMRMPLNIADNKPPDMSNMFDLLKKNMPNDEGDMMSVLMPLLMTGGDAASLFSGLSGLNSGGTDNKNTDKEYTDSDSSDEIDNLFKDFIDETRNENNE